MTAWSRRLALPAARLPGLSPSRLAGIQSAGLPSPLVHAFRVFGGVPARGIYDNMRTAVDRVGRGKERQVNARFLAMASHDGLVRPAQHGAGGMSAARRQSGAR